jgi:hypothetical protein
MSCTTSRQNFGHLPYVQTLPLLGWYEQCEAADTSYTYSRLMAGRTVGRVLSEGETTREPGVILAALETYLYCESDPNVARNTRGREGLGALSPYLRKVAESPDMGEVERLIENESPWPDSSTTGSVSFVDANDVLTKSLLMAVDQNQILNAKDRAVALTAALNFLKSDVRLIRRQGAPTEQERQARAECATSFPDSIEQSKSWQTLVSRQIDPLPLIADLMLPVASACGPAQN